MPLVSKAGCSGQHLEGGNLSRAQGTYFTFCFLSKNQECGLIKPLMRGVKALETANFGHDEIVRATITPQAGANSVVVKAPM
jgi:hypothetical protein